VDLDLVGFELRRYIDLFLAYRLSISMLTGSLDVLLALVVFVVCSLSALALALALVFGHDCRA
jgi:hypothetical protein